MMIERRKEEEEDLFFFFHSQIDFNDDFDEHLLMPTNTYLSCALTKPSQCNF